MLRKMLKDLRRPVLAAVLAGASALPVTAQTLADTMVDAYRHSALLDQNRAVLRAADEDTAAALAQLRPVIQWVAEHTYNYNSGLDTRTTSIALQAQITLYDWGRNAFAIDIAKETVLATRAALVGVELGDPTDLQGLLDRMKSSRLIVDRRVADEFEALVAAKMQKIVVGDPLDEATQIGAITKIYANGGKQ